MFARRTVVIAFGTSVLASACPSRAQEAAAGTAFRETVTVTGSHIARPELESALPVQVIRREDIERSGAFSVGELMSTVSANMLGTNEITSGINDRAGLSAINLRGIGDGSTLVLLNGRRVANYAFDGSAVDVNAIPISAVERVEILKDGASAIYGTDAIAGVVNFMLRRDYRGAEATAHVAATEHGGGGQRQAVLTAGYGDLATNRFNVFVTATYQKDQKLIGTSRPFSSTGFRPEEGLNNTSRETFPANIFDPGRPAWYNPTYAQGCDPPYSVRNIIFARGVRWPVCRFDTGSFLITIPPAERTSVFTRASYRIDPDHLLFAELAYSRKDLTLSLAPTPASTDSTPNRMPLVYPAGGPYYPTDFAAAHGLSGDLPVFYRTLSLGPRIDDITATAWRSVVGAEGDAYGWTYASALAYSRNRAQEDFGSGWVSAPALIDAMTTGIINPFGPSSPDAEALLRSTQIGGKEHWATGTTLEVDARASREIVRLPAGPVALAVGADARHERLDNAFADFVRDGGVMSVVTAQQSTGGSRTVHSGYVEAVVPLLEAMQAQLAARYDHYSDFGSTTNPKVALRWHPASGFVLRGSWGTGFRAPTLYDLFTPQQGGHVGVHNDPVRCPVTRSPVDCDVEFASVRGGNPDLKPEKSEQLNAGVVVTPAPGVSVALDYWKINKARYIGTLDEFLVFGNFAYYQASNIVRGPPDAAYPALPGPIRTVLLLNQNLGDLRTRGFDIDLRWADLRTPLGRFRVTLEGTYIVDWKLQPDALDYISALGRDELGPLPRWRHHAALDWEHGPWGATLAETYQSGYEDANAFNPARFVLSPAPAPRRVSSYELWDLQVRYSGLRSTRLAMGVKNLFDRAPPFTNQNGVPQVGYDPAYGDPRGRTYYARVTYTFD